MRHKKIDDVIHGDCYDVLKKIKPDSVDLIYLDPPYFTQKEHRLQTRDGEEKFAFSDRWQNLQDYVDHLRLRLIECKKVLKKSGSLFLHCDKTAAYHIKILLDEVFGVENFQSEIIWFYRRWSNAKKGLLSNHQTIFFYSKSGAFKFNTSFEDYSPSTNVDQIVQLRERDGRNKSTYKKNYDGSLQLAATKKGVPLGDVWDIPYLNPKAKERAGYPTQKPILLLEKIIKLVTDEGDFVIDPYCGSGTTLVAAKLLKRKYCGIDTNSAAVALSRQRLRKPIKTESRLLKKGRASYLRRDAAVDGVVKKLNATPVQRNKGIDGLLSVTNQLVPFKVVASFADLELAATSIKKATKKNGYRHKALYCEWVKNLSQIKKIENEHQVFIFNNVKMLNKKINNF